MIFFIAGTLLMSHILKLFGFMHILILISHGLYFQIIHLHVYGVNLCMHACIYTNSK